MSRRLQNRATTTETTVLELPQEDRPRGEHHTPRVHPRQQPTCSREFSHPPRKGVLPPANKRGCSDAKRKFAPSPQRPTK